MSSPTAEWDRIGDRFYRKVQQYSDVFDPAIELENYRIIGAPCGGALALQRDEEKIFAYRGTGASKSSIDIYSCSGRLIRRINWEQAPIKGVGWSEDEKLIVVRQDGIVNVYSDLSDDFTDFTLGREAEENGIVDCRFWVGGFVALLSNNQLVVVSRYDEPRPKLLATPPSDTVISWAIIPPGYTLSRSVEVLLGIGQTINVVDATDSEDRLLQNGPFRRICVSPNGRFIALFTDDGKVWVISSDFQDKLSEYDSRSKILPRDMQWCGNDAVVLAWEDEIHVVGPNGAASKYYYDGWVHLVPDVDGIRIFTNDVCEFLQNVPDVIEDTFRLGSTSPAAILLDCVEQLENQSPKADDNIQLIKTSLSEAIRSCIAAAGHEFSVHWQKRLMKAASFGKTVIDLFDSDVFVRMSETIRVLNALRFYKIGMPLSYDQYDWIGPERLIQRLMNRHEYALALSISDFLRLPTDRIFVHWAVQKVRVSTAEDEEICRRVVQKIQGKQGVSFEEIARAAHEQGNNHLATLLLDHEPRAGKQVPLLLSMEEDTTALDKAVSSGDTDLVLFVLLQLKRKLPQATFFRTINSRPVATALVESTAIAQDRELLKDLYYQDDRRLDGSNLLFMDALSQQPDVESEVNKLRMATKLVQDSKEHAFQARSLDEFSRLLRLQDALNADTNLTGGHGEGDTPTISTPGLAGPFSGLSLHETIYQLALLNANKRAQRVVSDFRVPDKTYWWIRLRALVASRNWRELEDIASKNKKSPIGWEPFFNEVLAAGNARVAGNTFVPKCTEKTPRERSEMYEKCGMLGKAGEEAGKAKDRERLEELRGRAQGKDLVEVERAIGLLTRGR